MSPPASQTKRVLTGAGVALLSVAAVVLLVLLNRNPASDPTQTTISEEQEFSRLRAEAVSAAEGLFQRIANAYATADASLLDGVYVPGSDLEKTQKRSVEALSRRGERADIEERLIEIKIVSLGRSSAQLEVTRIIGKESVIDARTGEIKSTKDINTKNTYRLLLTRIDGRWVVEGLLPKE